MPRTPPTIVAPLPRDPRVMVMAKTLNVSRADAYTAVADVWAMLAADAEGDIVKGWTLEMLDAVVEGEVAGCGAAMLQAGLVGVVDDGLVLPAELRRHERAERDGRKAKATAGAEDEDGKRMRERLGARNRKRKERAKKSLTKPASVASPSPTAEAAPTVKWTPRCLGTVDGHAVMLLYSKKTQAWFYCLKDAFPNEWTASVADPENPSFAEALAGLHAAMKREDSKGLGSADTFSPSLTAVVAAAERYRAERTAAAVDDARRDEGNRALAEASAEDQGDIDHEPAERDSHAHVTRDERDSVTVTEVSRPESVTGSPNSSGEAYFGSVTCHAAVTPTVPSSSNSLSASGNEGKENTTTTSSVTDAERDHEDRILDRIAPRVDPEQAKQQERHRLWLERVAGALGTTTDAVESQRRLLPDILLARMKAAGIDPKTGESINADAAGKPSRARGGVQATTEPIEGDKPAGGSVDARDGDEPDEDFEVMKDRLVEQLRGVAVAAAADVGVKYA